MIYENGQSYEFPVVAALSEGEVFTVCVSTPSGDQNVTVTKLAFQKNQPLPETLQCRVKGMGADGLPVLSPDIRQYVFQLYSDVFRRGGTLECMVISVPDNPAEEPYGVRDRNGIFYNIREPEAMLSRGQKIRCRFSKMTTRFFVLERVDEGANIPYYSPRDLFAAAGVDRRTAAFIAKKVLALPQMETVRAEIGVQAPQWPLTAAAIVRRHLNEWYLGARLGRNNTLHTSLIRALEKTVLFLLEGSSFLAAMPAEHRRSVQNQLTSLADSLEPYAKSLRLIAAGTQDGFVASLFDKLEKSGYLYHPSVQLGILMLVFRENPAKVRENLNRIFESIFGRELENWKREPFRSAFIEQFEMYVRQARRDIDALPLADTRAQKEALETIINAIALQLVLSDNENDIRERTGRNLSLFYRYISLLRPLQARALLTKSFLALLDAPLPERLDYAQLREPMMMMTQATVLPEGDPLTRIQGTHTYSTNTVNLTVSADGIAITRKNTQRERVVPEGLMGWLHPQVYVPGIRSISGAKLRRLADHQTWWADIEQSLFDSPVQVQATETLETPKPGDEVWIVIEDITDIYDNDPTFLCRIHHEGIIEATGTLRRSAIVNYNLRQPSPTAYRDASGTPLGFYAKITDVSADGKYIFSLSDEVDKYIQNTLNFENEYTAVVTGSNPMGFSAISSDGIGLYLADDEQRDHRPGEVVHFKLRSGHTLGSIFGYITDTPVDETDKFDKTHAFSRLMNAIGEQPASDETEGDPDQNRDGYIDADEELRADHVRELVEIFRFYATGERDLIAAYDYLRYARLLALTIGDKALAENLATHAALLSQHQFYAVNNRIDREAIEKLRERTAGSPLLRMIFHRLEIVSWLGAPDRNPELYATAQDPESDLEGSLARMVLSFNMLQMVDGSDAALASSLKEQIKNKLNVNSETKVGKYYGSESKYLEFKTSIVYPAHEPGKEMREDPAGQQFHILSRIAGLLNAAGGKLYIGVNNDGYAVGLRDDLKYFERHKARFGSYTQAIANIDSMCVFLENLIHETFGPSIARKIEVAVDEEAEKDVILIKVEESLQPVMLEKRLFVRQSGQSTREYHGDDISDFLAERALQSAERSLRAAAAIDDAAAVEAAEAAVPADTPEKAPAEKAAPTVMAEPLALSRWRPNVLHEYDNDYIEPYGYLYFTADGAITFSKSDLYMETRPECRGAMAISHEMKDGFLVLGFDEEKAVKIPLSEVYERGENNPAKHFRELRLVFAGLAQKDDAILTVVADNSGALWKRAFPLKQIESGHLSSNPKRLHDSAVNHTVAWEVIDSSATGSFADCTGSRIGTRRMGSPLRVRESDSQTPEVLDRLAMTCSPQ